MNANINFAQVISGIKAVVGLASLAIISVVVLQVFGIQIAGIKGNVTELSALAAAAAFISR